MEIVRDATAAPSAPAQSTLTSTSALDALKKVLRCEEGQDAPARQLHKRFLDNYCRINHVNPPRTNSEADRRAYARFSEFVTQFLGRVDLGGLNPLEQLPDLFIRFLEERKSLHAHSSVQREREEENRFREDILAASSVYDALRIFLDKVDGHDRYAERLHASLSDTYGGTSFDDVAEEKWMFGRPVHSNPAAYARFTGSIAEFLTGLDRRELRPAEQLPALYTKFLDGGKNVPAVSRFKLLERCRFLTESARDDQEREFLSRAASIIGNRKAKIGESEMRALWSLSDAILNLATEDPDRAAAISALEWALGAPGSGNFRRHFPDLFLLETSRSAPWDVISAMSRAAFVRLAIAALNPNDADALPAIEFLCQREGGCDTSFAPTLQMAHEDLNYLRHIAAAEDNIEMGNRALAYHKWKIGRVLESSKKAARPEHWQAISDWLRNFYFGPVLAITGFMRERRMEGGSGRRSMADRFMWNFGRVMGAMAARNEFDRGILDELLTTDPDLPDLKTQVTMAVLENLPRAIGRGVKIRNEAPADIFLDLNAASGVAMQLAAIIEDIMAEIAVPGPAAGQGREIRILPHERWLVVTAGGQHGGALEERNRNHIGFLPEKIAENATATAVYLGISSIIQPPVASPPLVMGAVPMAHM